MSRLFFVILFLVAFGAPLQAEKLPQGATLVASSSVATTTGHDILDIVERQIPLTTGKVKTERLERLRDALLPVVSLDKDGSPTIDESEFPTIDLYRDGTGRSWFSAWIPLVTPFPVVTLVKRCNDCLFYIAKVVWPQSGSDHLWEGITWFEVEEGIDRIDFESVGKTKIAGDFEVEVAVLHYPTGVFMTKTFSFRVDRMDFGATLCTGAGGQSVLDIHVESIHGIIDNVAYVVVNGVPRYVELVRNEHDGYRATATVESEQELGPELDITVQLWDRAQQKHLSLPYGFLPCGGKG